MTQEIPPRQGESSTKKASPIWQPTKYLEPSKPPRDEAIKAEEFEIASTVAARWGGGVDFAGRAPKLLKPRRTVDYTAGVGRMRTLEKLRAGLNVTPPIHPNPSDMSNLLPPMTFPSNPTSSICDVFIHSSMNKERSPIGVARWSPDGRWCVTGNQMGQFTLWNGATFNFESLKQAHDHPVRCLAYAHSGNFFISADQSGVLKYFTPTINNLTSIPAHREACRGISFSPNDEKFVTGGDDGTVKIWSFGEAKEEKVLAGHGWDVRCVDWHPTKGLVVSGSKDLLVKFWDPRSGKDLSTLHSHRSVINDCKWSPNGNLIATVGGDGLARLFDIRTFKELESLKGHEKEITSVTWHPAYNNLLTTGGMDGSLLHWCLDSAEPTKPVTTVQYAHDSAVWTLDYHPLGYVLASASKDYSTKFWCRARPQGGQESDRWHVGDDESQALGVPKWKQEVDEDEMDRDQPLPGLAPAAAMTSRDQTPAGAPRPQAQQSFAFPGLAPADMPPQALPSTGAKQSRWDTPSAGQPGPPMMAFGGGGQTGGRVGRPLPSQQDMLQAIGYSAEPRGRGGDRGGRGRQQQRQF